MIPSKSKEFKEIKENFLKEFKKKPHHVSYKNYDFNKKNKKLLDLYDSTPPNYSFIYNDNLFLKTSDLFNPDEKITFKNKEEAFNHLMKNGLTNCYPDFLEHDIHFFGSSILINISTDMNTLLDGDTSPSFWLGALIIPSKSKIYKEFHPKKFNFIIVDKEFKGCEVTYDNQDINLLLTYSKYCEIEPRFEFNGFIEDETYFRYRTYDHPELRHGLKDGKYNDEYYSCSNYSTYFDGRYSRIGYDADQDAYEKNTDIFKKIVKHLNLSKVFTEIYPTFLEAYEKSPPEKVNNLHYFERSTSRRDDWFMNYDLVNAPKYIKLTKKFYQYLIEVLKDKEKTVLLCADMDKLYKHRDEGVSSGLERKIDKNLMTNLQSYTEYLNLVLLLYYSDYGKFLPSIDSKTGKIHKIKIKIEDDKTNNLFYNIIHDQIPLIDLHHVYDGSTFLTESLNYNPADGEKSQFSYLGKDYSDEIDQGEINIFQGIGIEGDLEKSKQLCNDIIDEAVNNKIWTIPYQAPVEIKFGNFTSVNLTEYKNKIFFLLNHRQNISFHGSLDIDKKFWKINISEVGPGFGTGIPDEAADKLADDFMKKASENRVEAETSIKLLISGIIRDFWVVEVRESVFKFQRKSVKRKIDGKKGRTTIIKYIPRIKYIKKLKVESTQRELSYQTRRAHWVVAHLRKIDGVASDLRVAIAKNYGFTIQPGFTFVKPFEKGGLKGKNVIFRSKSATKLLFNEDTKILPGNEISDWFKFELDVKKWFEKNEFEVEHTGGAGDGGKDLIAVKKEGNDEITYYIQCKCWSKPVGVDVTRELLGTLTDEYPKNTKGLIITNSTFTNEAEEFAARNNIGLVDYKDLFGKIN